MAFSQLTSRWVGSWRGHSAVRSVGIACQPSDYFEEPACVVDESTKSADESRQLQRTEWLPRGAAPPNLVFPASFPIDSQLFSASHSAFITSFQQLLVVGFSGRSNHPFMSLETAVHTPVLIPVTPWPPPGVRSFGRRSRASAFDPSDYLPSSETPPTRLSRPQAPSLPRPSAAFLGKENTPEMRAKAELFEQAQLAFQQRGYLVHPKSQDREEQLKRLEKVFEVFGKHGFPVMRLQAALKWELRHLEKARGWGADEFEDESEFEQFEQETYASDEKEVFAGTQGGERRADFSGDVEGTSEPSENQLDRARFHTRAERKAMKKALEEAATAKGLPDRAEQSISEVHEGAQLEELLEHGLAASESYQNQEQPSTSEAESILQDTSSELAATFGDAGPPPGGADVAHDDKATTNKWKRTERRKRAPSEGPPPGTPFAGSLRGLEKGADGGGVFTEFVRAPTQPVHRGGQGPGLSMRQKRLAAQIQRELAEIMVSDAGLRSSLLEEAGFAALEVRLTPELDTAFVRWTCNEGSEKEVEKQLGRIAGRLRTGLFKALAMPFSPRLEFKYDTLSAQIHAIEDAFDRLHDL